MVSLADPGVYFMIPWTLYFTTLIKPRWFRWFVFPIAWKRAPASPKSSTTRRKDCASVAAISLSLARSGLSVLIVQVTNQVKNKFLRTSLAKSPYRPLFAELEWENHSCSWLLFGWEVYIPCYHLFRKDRMHRQRDGVGGFCDELLVDVHAPVNCRCTFWVRTRKSKHFKWPQWSQSCLFCFNARGLHSDPILHNLTGLRLHSFW